MSSDNIGISFPDISYGDSTEIQPIASENYNEVIGWYNTVVRSEERLMDLPTSRGCNLGAPLSMIFQIVINIPGLVPAIWFTWPITDLFALCVCLSTFLFTMFVLLQWFCTTESRTIYYANLRKQPNPLCKFIYSPALCYVKRYNFYRETQHFDVDSSAVHGNKINVSGTWLPFEPGQVRFADGKASFMIYSDEFVSKYTTMGRAIRVFYCWTIFSIVLFGSTLVALFVQAMIFQFSYVSDS